MKKKNEKGSAKKELAEFRVAIEEFPNPDIVEYHISDSLTTKEWDFESEEDLKEGGALSINFDNEEVPEELQYLAGAFLAVDGVVEVGFSKYKIRLTKAPVFTWGEMKKDILSVLKVMAKERKIKMYKMEKIAPVPISRLRSILE